MAPLIIKMIFLCRVLTNSWHFPFSIYFWLATEHNVSDLRDQGSPWAAGCLGPAQVSYTKRAFQSHTGPPPGQEGPKSRAREETGQVCSHLFISTYYFWLYTLPVPFFYTKADWSIITNERINSTSQNHYFKEMLLSASYISSPFLQRWCEQLRCS